MTNQWIIQCQSLVIGHSEHKALCKPFELNIKEHQWLGVVGENGIGKSTLLKNILGFIPPVSGKLSVFGHPPGKKNQWISYIPQERELNLNPNISAITLVKARFNANRLGLPAFGRHIDICIKEIFNLVGAEAYAHKPFETLSGGQKKRVYLAQALINKPRLLLLDEPLSDLDPQAKQDFIHALKKIHIQHNVTLLIISHDMHEIAHELDNFIHFKNQHIHLCQKMPCLKEDRSVIL